MADGTTYSQSLQQILGQPQTPGVFGYGFSNADIQRLQAAGITPAQLMQMGLSTQPQTTTSPYQSGGQGPTTSPSAGGIQQANNAAMLQAMLQLGGGQQQQTGPPPPGNAYGQLYPLYAQDAQGNPTGKPVYANPTNAASLLGAAALGMPAVINPPPNAALDPRSGVSKVGGALIGTNVPQVTGGPSWQQIGQEAQLPLSELERSRAMGGTPALLAKAYGVSATNPLAGPWTDPRFGSVFTPVARTTPTQAIPLQAGLQPTATGYNPTATPFAQAPPAPGLQIPQTPFVAAHTNALADAGKALFAHFGGDPNSASPADIANFHSQLTSAIPLAAAPQPTAAKKMAAGGVVPGRGNKDTVPALLTPGEYVIPKDQVAQFFGGRTPAKMAGGGSVQDPDPDPNAPPEARRQRLTTAAAQSSQTPPPAAPGGGSSSSYSSLTSGLATAAQTYGSAMANFGGGGRIPAGSTAGAGAYGTVGDFMSGKGSAGAAGSLGTLPAGGRLQSALGGIGSGLTQAAQAIASSVGPWQMQQSAIPAPPPAPAPVQFQQPQVAPQAQQAVNPYAAYAANQARYPTSPYYT